MKRILILLIALCFPILARAQTFTATLSGAGERRGGDPDGAGLAVVTFDGTSVHYTILVSGIERPAQTHIDVGTPGVGGNAVIDLSPTFIGGTATGVAIADRAIVAAIARDPGNSFVNVRNSDFPRGAIGGRLSSTDSTGSLHAEFPVVGKVTGLNDTNFVTDMSILNTGSLPANVKLEYYGQSSGMNLATATADVTVGAGEQKVLSDVVGTTLGISSGMGGLVIDSDQPVLTSIRVLNDRRGEGAGTAGFAAGPSEARMSGTIGFLTNNADFRTNIGYFNPGGASGATLSTDPTSNVAPDGARPNSLILDEVSVTFVAHRTSDGAVLDTQTLSVAGGSMVQQPVSFWLKHDAEEQFYVTWTSDGPLHVYASVIDNKTGDSILNR